MILQPLAQRMNTLEREGLPATNPNIPPLAPSTTGMFASPTNPQQQRQNEVVQFIIFMNLYKVIHFASVGNISV